MSTKTLQRPRKLIVKKQKKLTVKEIRKIMRRSPFARMSVKEASKL